MFGRELKKPLFVRGMTVMAVFLLLAAALGARLWYLQMIEADKYKTGAYEQYTTEISISPKRGTIFDRNMTPLAVSDTVETVFISPYEIAMQNENKAPDKMVDIAEQKNKIADFLSETLEVDRAQIIERMDAPNPNIKSSKRKWNAKLVIRSAFLSTKTRSVGIHLEEDVKRSYPYGNLASHVIGFTNADQCRCPRRGILL